MAKHKPKDSWDIRNKTLSNLMIVWGNLEPVKDCKKEDRPAFRKELIEEIMKELGIKKRSAYDYIQAIEYLSSRNIGNAHNVLVGGKKEHNRFSTEYSV